MDKYPKRLIEVDLPIKRISAHARREKSIRHGHISTLHIWWARRPLAACRAVICASLWPDPADPLCPDLFRDVARNLMTKWATDHLGKASSESFGFFVNVGKNTALLTDNLELRRALLNFIADFADWDNSTVREYLDTSRDLTQIAHEALGGVHGTHPLVVDPFAGGGAIPLEALRVGADVAASDINDVPVLINKLMIELLPSVSTTEFENQFRSAAEILNKRVETRVSPFFNTGAQGERPFGYFWARTVVCEGPSCGKIIPLVGNPHLSKRKGDQNSIAISYQKDSSQPEIVLTSLDSPSVRSMTKGGAALCTCGYTTPVTSVRRQLSAKKGGASESLLLAVGYFNDAGKKCYRAANTEDQASLEKAILAWQHSMGETNDRGSSIYPNEKLYGKAQMNVGLYGMTSWQDIFTPRQLLVLRTYQEELVNLWRENNYTPAMGLLLAIAVNKLVDYSTSLCRWVPGGEFAAATLGGEKKLPMMWDFVEIVSYANGPGSWQSMTDWVGRVLSHFSATQLRAGTVAQADARTPWLPEDSVDALITDPPYYDAIWYGDLGDLFAVWLRRSASSLGLFNGLDIHTQKDLEIIRSTFSKKDNLKDKDDAFYEQGMKSVFSGYRISVKPEGIAVVVFAHKSTSGWETMLSGLIDGGWTITSSWPIDTEREARMTSLGQSALASSVHLVCRPRENPDGSLRTDEVGDWRDVLQELPHRIHEWMPRLAEEGVVGADAIFACLGPALEIFSRYSSVEKASGEKVVLREYLEQVWAAVAKEALNMIFAGADTSGFEEDARLTAMWLWTLATASADSAATSEESDDAEDDENGEKKNGKTAGYALEYDAARKIAQGLGIHLEDLSSLVNIQGDTAVLLPVASRTRYLFGKDSAQSEPATKLKKKEKQQMAFDFIGELQQIEQEAGDKWAGEFKNKLGKTILDQLHQAMILFAAGRGEAMKRLLVDDGVGKNAFFWRLAQALSALYPGNSEEKRWVDGVLARKKGLGL